MDILINNPWFSGICIAVIAGLILYHIFGIGKKEKDGDHSNSMNRNSPFVHTAGGNISAGRDVVIGGVDKSSNSPHMIVTGNILAKSIHIGDNIPNNPSDKSEIPFNITPKEIEENIKSLPPGQRKEIANSYKGVKVSWILEFRMLEEQENLLYIISCYRYDKYASAFVTFKVPRELYPQLRVIKENHKFKANGIIENIDPISRNIHLTNCKLFI